MTKRAYTPLTDEYARSVTQYVESSAFAGASDAVIARAVNASVVSLRRRFGSVLAKRRAERQIALAAAQQKFALRGNATLLIFLGKQPEEKGGLGQVDEMAIARQLDLSKLSDEELESLSAGKAKLKLVNGGADAAPKAAHGAGA